MAPDASDALAVRETVQTFLTSAKTGNLDLLKKLAKQLDDGKGLAQTVADVKDANQRGALHFAAREGQTETCKFLLEECNIDVNVKDEDGETPLIHAARQGHTATTKYLVKCGADPSIPSELGAAALHHSAGIDVDFQSHVGTPLIWAAGNAQHDAVKVLLGHKANPNAKTEDDVTPLLSAVAAGSLACSELLIKAGANVNVSAGGATPMHIAADGGNPEMINCLLQAGANPDATDEDERDGLQDSSKLKDVIPPKLPEVTPEAKNNAAEAKARADAAYRRKDYMTAIDAYTQAIDFDPTDATLLSNRSLSWIRLGQAEYALADAKACRALRPDWPKACYREGAALRLMQKFEEAANAFYEAVILDPENKELVTAFREAVEAGRKFHDRPLDRLFEYCGRLETSIATLQTTVVTNHAESIIMLTQLSDRVGAIEAHLGLQSYQSEQRDDDP